MTEVAKATIAREQVEYVKRVKAAEDAIAEKWMPGLRAKVEKWITVAASRGGNECGFTLASIDENDRQVVAKALEGWLAELGYRIAQEEDKWTISW